MVGEHNPTAGGAFQARTEFRNHGLGRDQTYHYDPPRPQEPINHRRVLHQNAIDTWSAMFKRGWRPCRATAR